MLYSSRWEGERDCIVPCSEVEARDHYEHLPEYEMTFFEVFGEEPEIA